MEVPESCSLDTFWTQLQRAPEKVLLLDYDGTLAPFRRERSQAVPYPGVRDILEKIQMTGKTRLIIVSGRNTRDIVSLLDLRQRPEIWGGHGFERLLPDGSVQEQGLTAGCLQNLRKAVHWAEEHGYTENCEQKKASVAFHWRGEPQDMKVQLDQEVREAWKPFTAGGELEIHPFDGGLELRWAGMHKGEVIRQILKECSRDAVIAYLGDDRTDEDAFSQLQGKGLSVLVRDTCRETLADCWLQPPDQLLGFLQNWHQHSAEK